LKGEGKKDGGNKAGGGVLLAPGTGFVPEKGFLGAGVGGMVSGWFKQITYIVPLISIIITSVPPQIIRN